MFVFPTRERNCPPHSACRPQLHFAGRNTPREIAEINRLLAEYGTHIVGYRLREPIRSTYSLELQFDEGTAGQAALAACRAAYEAFTTSPVGN